MIPQVRIVIDGRSLQGEPTGVGTYTFNLVDHLLRLDPSLTVRLITSRALPAIGWADAARVQVETVPDPFHNNFLWTNFLLRRRLGRQPNQVFHSPGYTIPLRVSLPSVLAVHDVSYAAHPEWYPHRGGAVRRAWYRLSARSADFVLAPSEFSRREIERVYALPAQKIVVVPLGVDRGRFSKIEERRALDEIRSKYDLRRDFLLFVGDIHRRRNPDRLVDAFRAVAARECRDIELVFIGRILDSSMRGIMTPGPDARPIRMLGYVPAPELPLFYNLATAFVFPSLYEGFGLGVLEAMSCGCPVIVGQGTACEEVAGEAGVCVDPVETKSIADGIAALLRNPEFARKQSEAGLRRAGQFSWARTATETGAVYRRLLSPHS